MLLVVLDRLARLAVELNGRGRAQMPAVRIVERQHGAVQHDRAFRLGAVLDHAVEREGAGWAREQISERVFTDKRKAEFHKYLEKLRAQAIIEWKNEDVKKAFEAGVRQQTAPSAP